MISLSPKGCLQLTDRNPASSTPEHHRWEEKPATCGSDELIKANKCGFSSVEQQRFRTPLGPGIDKLAIFHSAHAKGIAMK
ncbi:putative Methyltransferase protein 7A [Daphnia magna]|uniref:Putative Methyltransferase protein 7A n=1 Tax=Daphnia magna TaxID=35525 RepID=A0A164IIP3_9CRUS|nr:putative Methyltransferase protein 7A [Daphnia magna]